MLGHPTFGPALEFLISPVFAVLLCGMFAQIPFLHLREAFANRRFTAALITDNFVVVQGLVWFFVRLLLHCYSAFTSFCSSHVLT